ncbi:hypothetical protein HL653_10045 [Sphingomonas sp. AP4-R1]|uniref:hypothetical protein n=1 Tax=Sphingomonas sp. AP4-R1 TaxID=2735134 RepID=UPI0014938F4F|nr:hypothetical protein [Sphingomonas sp. AP4-R1]QJU58095.1 hypothetical protein HL653_10045 [Sphingomonas sp. AP4-R1]
MPRETPSPIDLPDDPVEAPGLGWTAGVIAIASLLLLAINAVALRDWANDLTPSPVQAQLADATQGWLDVTEAVGIGKPRAWLHDQWKKAENARFGGAAPDEGAPPAP